MAVAANTAASTDGQAFKPQVSSAYVPVDCEYVPREGVVAVANRAEFAPLQIVLGVAVAVNEVRLRE